MQPLYNYNTVYVLWKPVIMSQLPMLTFNNIQQAQMSCLFDCHRKCWSYIHNINVLWLDVVSYTWHLVTHVFCQSSPLHPLQTNALLGCPNPFSYNIVLQSLRADVILYTAIPEHELL